jgi:HEAT repeat protein
MATLTLAALGLFAALELASPALGHGGTYRGPGSGIGPGGAGPSTGGPSGGGPSTGGSADAAGDLTAWQMWWSLNRDGYLNLRAALMDGSSASKSDAFFLGGAKADPDAGRPSLEFVNERVVPALLELSGKDEGPEVATATIFALARIGGAQSGTIAKALTTHLSSLNQEISETAALATGLLADPSSSSTLVALLDNTPDGRKLVGREEVPVRTRAFAAYGLGLLGQRATNPDVRRFVVHHLVSALEADTSASYDVEVACILSIGLLPLEPIASPGEGAPPSASRTDQFAFLVKWLTDPRKPDGVRIYAPVALARLAGEDPALRPALVALCCEILSTGNNASPAMQQSVVMALGIAADGDADAVDQRARTLLRKQVGSDGDRLSRRLALISAARAYSRRGDGTGWPSTIEDGRAFLTAQFSRASTPDRPWVALALGIHERSVVEAGVESSDVVRAQLSTALAEHASPVEAGAFALGLGLFAGDDAQKPLMAALANTRDDQVRSAVSVALGMARVTAGIETLQKLVVGAKYTPSLLREASIGLGLLGDKSVSAELVDMLRDAVGLSAQSAIAIALGHVGDAKAVAPLLAMAMDETRSKGCRAFSVVAVGLICDRRLLPWNSPIAADVNYWLPPGSLFDPVTAAGILDIL